MSSAKKSSFYIRRIHSLVGLLPIGIFMIVHFLINSTVFINGNEPYLAAVNFMKTTPGVIFLEVGLIAIPLLFHAIYGLYVVYVAHNNALQYKYYRNWAFYLQRITAILTTIFIVIHVWTLRLAVHDSQMVIQTLVGWLQNPVTLAFYIIGYLAAVYHFGNGLFTFLITWGVAKGDRAQKVLSIICFCVFLALAVWGGGLLYSLAQITF